MATKSHIDHRRSQEGVNSPSEDVKKYILTKKRQILYFSVQNHAREAYSAAIHGVGVPLYKKSPPRAPP